MTQNVLSETASHCYELTHPLVDIDALVLAYWAVPTGIFGGLTALVYRGLSLAPLVAFDIFVTEGTSVPARVADMPLRRHALPAHLLHEGVAPLTPSLPGTVAVPMFAPAVAVAQVVADPTLADEDREDAVLEYLATYSNDAALADALRLYAIPKATITELVQTASR